MHDWRSIVHGEFTARGLPLPGDGQVVDELAMHLQDAYDEARRAGVDDRDAVACAMAQAGSWTEFSTQMQRLEGHGGSVRSRMKTLWFPGLGAVAGLASMVTWVGWLAGGERWATSTPAQGAVHAAGALALCAVLGAAASTWSRRSGGSWRHQLGAGLMPVVLQCVVVLVAIGVSGAREEASHRGAPINLQLRVVLAFVLAPGSALALGALSSMHVARRREVRTTTLAS